MYKYISFRSEELIISNWLKHVGYCDGGKVDWLCAEVPNTNIEYYEAYKFSRIVELLVPTLSLVHCNTAFTLSAVLQTGL